MLSIFLRRIKKARKQKSPDAATGGAPSGRTETNIGTGTETSDVPDTVSAWDELPVLLKIIRDNAGFLKIMYGDSLPVKNIMAATNQAMAWLEKHTPGRRDPPRPGSP